MASNSAVNLVIGATLSATFLGTTGRAKSHIARLGEDMARLRREQRSLTGGRLSGIGQRALVTEEVGQIMRKIDQLEARKKRLERSFERMDSGKTMMGSAIKSVGALWAGSQLFLQPIQAASAFEDAMLGVAKQMDGARDAQNNLTPAFFKMKADIQAMGRQIPMATSALAEMTAAGLRMGVAKDEVLGFVKTSSMMATAFELPAGELAEQMGKVAKVYGIPIPKIGDLADAINYLDDNAISKGGDIINVLQRIGGTASMLGMSAKDAAALGSTFLTLGASAEVAATASNAVMRELSVAASQPKRFQEGMEALGLTSEFVQKEMARDATGTIQMVLEKLNGLDKEQKLTVATQLFGKEYGDDVSKLAGGIEEYKNQIKLANSEEAKGSMARESAARDKTASAQWQILKNHMQELAVTIGDQLMPVAMKRMEDLVEILRGVTNFAKENASLLQFVFKQASRVIGAFVAAKLAMFGFGAVRYAIGSVTSGYGMLRENLTRLGDVLDDNSRKTRKNIGLFKRMGNEVGGLATDTMRVGRGMVGLVRRNPIKTLAILLAGGTYLVWRSWDSILAFFEERFPAVGGVLQKVGGFFKELSETVGGTVQEMFLAVPMLAMPVSKLGAVGGALQALGGKFVSLGKLVMAHPLLLAVGLLATAAFLVYKNWEPIKAFFTEVWSSVSASIGDGIEWVVGKFDQLRAWLAGWVDAGVALFGLLRDGVGKIFDWIGEKLGAIMGGIQKASAWVDEKTAPAKDAYWSVRTSLSDGIEGLANWMSGTERVRADAPVPSKEKALPQVASRGQLRQQNTVTINVNQQPGESGEALALRIAQAQARALAVRNRGSLYDHAVVY
ncbi:MAG: phage tail tape measure protein [Lautropia sp.]|nr:phage tail tape measure protein [Lautropia sp.]